MSCLTLGISFILLLWCTDVESVLVEIEQGSLRGETLVTSTNLGKYYSFKGIPYAAPPVGDLRFRAPKPPLKWKGIRNATEHGSICVQPDPYTNRVRGSEDCLYLNIYSTNLTPDHLLPVMVFIHGDTYTMGSGDSDKYSPDFLMPHNVVLVTLNFRLGALGFLAMNIEDAPGNAGMKDQISALKWVQQNIKKFGGDPYSVTIFGNSAGAAMVTLHVVSPAGKNLFKRAIAMSGSFFNDWYLGLEPVKKAFALGHELGLVTKNTSELTNFLKSVHPYKLIQHYPTNLLSGKQQVYNDIHTLAYFAPIVEKILGYDEDQYLTTCPFTIMSNRRINQVDFMISHTHSEGLKSTRVTENVFLECLSKEIELQVPLKFNYHHNPIELRGTDTIQNFYFWNETVSEKMFIPDYVKFNNYYTRFHFDIHSFMESMPKFWSVRQYFYVFRIYSLRNYFSRLSAEKFGVQNASHGDDLLYLFNGNSFNLSIDINSKDFEYVQLMCKLFTNFAKYGNPTPDNSLGAIWPEYNPKKTVINIEHNGKLVPGNIPIYTGEDLKFWRQLYLSVGVDPYKGYSAVNRS